MSPPRASGASTRDHSRTLRARRLREAFRATGDRRKLKRAKRIEADVRKSTMRRIGEAMRGPLQKAGVAFSLAFMGMGQSIARHLERVRQEQERAERALVDNVALGLFIDTRLTADELRASGQRYDKALGAAYARIKGGDDVHG